MSSVIKAKHTIILLGSISLEVFQLPDGSYQLSQTQVTEAVEKQELSFRQFLASKSPEALPYKGFRPVKLSVEDTNAKINAIPVDVAAAYWTKETIAGNVIAARILGACATESIERRADAAFGVQRTEEERNERMRVRMAGKKIRRKLTDAIKAYIERHPQLSDSSRKWLYVNTSQQVDLVVFGRKAAKLAEDLGVQRDRLRDALTTEELLLLQEVEDVAVRLIDLQDINPDEAVKQAAERLLIQIQNRVALPLVW